ncbi:nuclear transport factor 2 family protein [Zavarzinia sp. CC-PAN008]|uniref:nuclear transport factor 2 family protein n=1 Tax=Zavarzinia sp. CC-PAN008 TaxID=3243332 RepID=UPI003F7424CE
MSRWEDEAAIRSLMDRYGACVDERDWDGFATLFDDPLSTDFSRMDPTLSPATLPRAQHVGGARAVIGQFDATQHMISNIQIVLDGDTATCRAPMRAEHWLSGMRGQARYTMFGVYRNSFRRTADGWRISHLALEVVREEGNTAAWTEAVNRARRGT